MYVKVQDKKYWVEDFGGEGIPLLFLHGFTGSGDTFDESISLFTEDWRMIKLDMPGHRKTGEIGSISMEQFCDDLALILNELNVPKVCLIGYSMGGRAALSFTFLYPELVEKLVLESSSPGLSVTEEQMARQAKDQTLIDMLHKDGLKSFVNLWENLPLFHTQKSLPEEVQDRVRTERLSHTAAGLAQSLAGMGTGRQPSWWDKLPELSVDVLLITGCEDEKFLRINEEMEKLTLKVRVYKIREAGHAVHVEKPEIFAEIVEEFMLQ
ncbi:2-succinyl-6-hydroxy-2,4-cyclohexadiene-1-carboxylate synthase [Halobacillus sp. Marseille-Q1614]|uniref:2-succinyl-6-hydroxy-2, 4-cyclohexadiene-1-carboxylate synthase n=1 Tax=Halobacillus sp. Marseille-Q1614 TaxID=2709134 RepID=UPI001570AC97|nr:2-succinyl-6-hydroxy-2,4-cyclohexadiene-1-carboxylate synthase [Halobacillus sp. Marseille-Q1614]